jgi:tRNA pseudouridine55 synthase
VNGFLLVDKPEGLSSFKVVSKTRYALGIEKAGHCGTLDPLATGLLIVCLGRATKLAQFISKQDKSYTTEITLGYTSTTFDRDGELTAGDSRRIPTREEIDQLIPEFVGDIQQIAPMFSAVKHLGQPLYKYALKNQVVEQRLRDVHVKSIDVASYEYPRLIIDVACSSGTYIRSLADDIGERLGCGGHVNSLRRTSIGKWNVNDAFPLQTIIDRNAADEEPPGGQSFFGRAFISMEEMLDFPTLSVSELRSLEIPNGVPIRAQDIVRQDDSIKIGELVAVRTCQGVLLAVGRMIGNAAALAESDNSPVVEYVRVI